MPTVYLYARDLFLGEAVLREFDEGMGVAFGPFHPAPGYSEVRHQITAAAEARHQRVDFDGIELSARSKAGELIATGFVAVDDFADVDVDPEASVQFADPDQWVRLQRSAV